MGWASSVPILGALILKVIEVWERVQRAKEIEHQEQEYEDIKQDAKSRHAQRFGPSSGRMRDKP
ncbi:hypothetical protein VEJY3_09780 [Vibrio sp. EJY3]|nr:hypothetical protein VEJY3_09780 [Vibrio sp. EJY3]